MKELQEIRSFATEESVTVFWRKPDFEAGAYELWRDGALVGSTRKTHFTFEGLEPEMEYRLEIKCREAGAALTCVTGAKRRRIDVTGKPGAGAAVRRFRCNTAKTLLWSG